MQVGITAAITATASVSASAVATYPLSMSLVAGAAISPTGGVATGITAASGGTAGCLANTLPLNSSVADLRASAATTATPHLERTLVAQCVGSASFEGVVTLMKAPGRIAPPLIPGPGVLNPGPNTPALVLKVPRRL